MSTFVSYALVGFGGGIGAMARFFLTRLIVFSSFPLGTLLINVLGGLLMGLLTGYLTKYSPIWHNEARLLFATGVLGGFTTFSAFSLDAFALMERGQFFLGLVYVLLSVGLAISALALGLFIARGGF